MKILDRYILKAHAGTFFFAFVTIMFVFILSFLTKFLDRLVGKGLDMGIVVEMLLLQSAWMVGFAVPMAVLVSTVMAFGSLTNSSELTVMRSGGISMTRLIAPVLIASLVLSALVERFNNVMMPEANFRANALLSDITRMKPGFGIDRNAFSNVIKGYSIMARKVDNKTGELTDVVLYDRERPEVRIVITAAKGRIEFSSDYRYLIMTLDNGQIHELTLPRMDRYRKMVFTRHRYVFEAMGYGFERSDENGRRRGGRELSAKDLLAVGKEFRFKSRKAESSSVRGLEELKKQVELIRTGSVPVARPGSGVLPVAQPAKAAVLADAMIEDVSSAIAEIDKNRIEYNKYMVEYHKKYSLAFACMVFALVGAPLGVMARRGGFGVGAALSLLFFVMYWVMMIGGEKIAERGLVTPAICVWLPNVILSAAGLFMLFRLTRSVTASSR
ncbi:MAG: YjgP/YjgQ family permease [Chlorobiaceae bacterium]|nr:YjgP/YjgQ family permease [Chlorobiaceae bacterium]